MVALNRDEKLILRIIFDAYANTPAPKRDAGDVKASELIKLQASVGLRHVHEALRAIGSEAPGDDADPLLAALERLGDKLGIASMITPHIANATAKTLTSVGDAHERGDRPIVIEDEAS